MHEVVGPSLDSDEVQARVRASSRRLVLAIPPDPVYLQEASKRPSPDELLVHPWIMGNVGRPGRTSSSGTAGKQLVRSSSSAKLAAASRRDGEETPSVQLSSPSSFTAASAMRSMKAGLGALSSRVAAGRVPPSQKASALAAAAAAAGDGAARPPQQPVGSRKPSLQALANAGLSSSFTAGSSGAGPQRAGFGSSSSTSRFLNSAPRQREETSGKLLLVPFISAVTRSPTLSRSGSREGLPHHAQQRPLSGVLSDDTQVPTMDSVAMMAAGLVVGGQLEMDSELSVQRSSQSAMVRPYSGSGVAPSLGSGRISASSGGSMPATAAAVTAALGHHSSRLSNSGAAVPAPHSLRLSSSGAAGSPLMQQAGASSSSPSLQQTGLGVGHHSLRISSSGAAGLLLQTGSFSSPYQSASPRGSRGRASSSIIVEAGAALDNRQRGRSGVSASGAPPPPLARQRSTSVGRSGSFTQARPVIAPTTTRDVPRG